MKKPFLYILLFLYVAVQLKPLTAVIQDVLAHTFFKAQHMATIHFENGQYHLHAELKDISEKDNSTPSEKTPSTQKTNDTVSSHTTPEFNFQIKKHSLLSQNPTGSTSALSEAFLKINSPPPKA